MSLGERIRKRRQALKFTQNELAKALGVTPQHVSAIEQDKRKVSLSSLVEFAKELGVTTDYLLTGKEGIITEAIPAIKADKSLNLKAKKALISLIEELRQRPLEEVKKEKVRPARSKEFTQKKPDDEPPPIL